MGSQQHLYIVLGIIIVGIAIIVGTIPALRAGSELANKDAVTQDCLQIAASAHGYYMRPRLLGGGGRSFSDITMSNCGFIPDANGHGRNANGYFSVDGSSGTECEIIGYSNLVQGATVKVVLRFDVIGTPDYAGW
jgi:hypothetical protein